METKLYPNAKMLEELVKQLKACDTAPNQGIVIGRKKFDNLIALFEVQVSTINQLEAQYEVIARELLKVP